MYIITLTKQIFYDLWEHKLRSGLALFAVSWGTITLVLLMALGNGFCAASQKNMIGIVDGTFFIGAGHTSKAYQGIPKGRAINIKANTVINLEKDLRIVEKTSPVLMNKSNLSYQGKQIIKDIFGVAPSFNELQKIALAKKSRFIDELDIANKRLVAVIGYKIKKQLFGNKPALGKNVLINNQKFTVIGVTEEKGKHVYDWYKNKLIIPYTTYINMFGNQNVAFFLVVPDRLVEPVVVKNTLINYLAHLLHFSPGDKGAINLVDTTKLFRYISMFFFGIQLFLILCGAFNLGVGSLGVANIMFFIVSDRTREIGVKMAIGARDSDILWQILLEASIIIFVGACMGFLFSYLTVAILHYINLPDWLGRPVISPASLFIAFAILALFGFAAGIFPAKKASKMDPVRALWY